MMFKHHSGDVPKPISDLCQLTIMITAIVHVTHNLFELLLIGKSEAIYQTFAYIGSLAWNYIYSKTPTDVSYIMF